jgi:hypothetical protein
MTARVLNLPDKDAVRAEFNAQAVVEYYSR